MGSALETIHERHSTADIKNSSKVAAVNARWLGEVLAPYIGTAKVISSKIVDIIQGGSVKLRVALDYEDHAGQLSLPQTVIVKGGFDRHGEHVGDLVKEIYLSEMKSYRDVVEPNKRRMGINAPDIYFAGFYPTDDHPVVVMEDLEGKASFNSALKYMDYKDMRAFLNAIARIHAFWWDNGTKSEERLSWIKPIYESSIRGVLANICQPKLWASYMLLPRAASTPRSLRDPLRANAAIEQLGSIHADEEKPLLVHLDTHIGNTYFTAEHQPAFLDWSLYRAPWHHEVTYFMISALDISDRRRWERALLSYYLERLKIYGALEVPSFEEAWLRYRQEVVYGMVMWLGNGDADGSYQPESVNTAIAQRFVNAALDHELYTLFDV